MDKTIHWMDRAWDDASALMARDARAVKAVAGAVHEILQNSLQCPIVEGTAAPLRMARGAWAGFRVTIYFRETPNEYVVEWVHPSSD